MPSLKDCLPNVVPGFSPARALVIAALGMLPACDKVPLLAPTGSSITLSASALTVALGGSIEITATVLENAGTPAHNGTLVTFTTTLGMIEPREARTNNGQVTVRLLAGSQSGTAEVRARSGAATSGEAALMIRIGGAAAENVSLSVSPTNLPASGGPVQVVALVTDAAGNPVAGVPVTFTTSAGTLEATSVTTDAAGFARTTLTTTRDATVTATVAGRTPATANVTITTAPAVSISVTPQPAGQATAFTLTVTAGGVPVRSVTISFGDGESADLGTVSGSIGVSHVYRSAGAYTATLTATDTTGQRTSGSTVVNVPQPVPDPVPTVSITATVAPAGQVSTFTVTASAGGTGVTLTSVRIDFGDGTSASLGAAATSTASHIYASSGPYSVTATATNSAGQNTSATTIINVPRLGPPTVNLTASSCGLAGCAVGDAITFTATVGDLQGRTVVRYEWAFGDGTSATTTGNQRTHVYSAAATYTVGVTVLLSDDSTGRNQIEIVISP